SVLRPLATALAITALVVTAGFALVPRVGVAERVEPALTGFQAQVELDDVLPLLDDPTPMLRVEVLRGELGGALRLRGVALEHFDGRRWTAPSDRLPRQADLPADGPLVRVTPLGRVDEGALFSLGPIAG